MSQLSGYVATPSKRPAASGWLLVLALLSATAFVIIHYDPDFNGNRDRRAMSDRMAQGLFFAENDAIPGHLTNEAAALDEALASVQRTQYWNERALSSLSNPALTARRIELARLASRSAASRIDYARAELELARDLLAVRSKKQ